jgi:dihydroorotate dehydrogenase (fumarate)
MMPDLATTYMGLELRNPLVASASPLSQTLDGIRRLAAGGVGAIVLYSLVEEQLRHEEAAFADLAEAGTNAFAESLSYLPQLPDGPATLRGYLNLLERARDAVDVPLIASLNGLTPTGWVEHAREMEEAGAHAIELNVYSVPGDPRRTARDVEQRHLDVVTRVRGAVSVPLAVKITPYFSSTGEMAARLARAGADGLVLFNRFLQPDIDPETLTVRPRLALSSPEESRLPLTWISILCGRVGVSLAASTGVETSADVARYLLAGADVVMSSSALLRHGPDHAGALLEGLTRWMAAKGFATVGEARGLLSVAREANAEALQRAGYLGILAAARQTYAYRSW